MVGICPVSGLNQQLDSLKHLLDANVPDSTKIWAYTQVIWPNTKYDTDYALRLSRDMMKIAKAADRERWIRQAQYYFGVTYKNIGDYSKAHSFIDSVYKQSELMRDTAFMAYSSYQMAVILKEMKKYEAAIEWFNTTIRYYQYIKNLPSVAMALNAKAGLYREMKLYHRSISTYEMALKIHAEEQDSSGLTNVYNNLGNIYSEMDSFSQALRYYSLQEEINLARDDLSGMGFLYENRGRLYEKMGQIPDAVISLRKSVEIRRNLSQNQTLAITLFQLASSLIKQGDVEEARACITEGLAIAEKFEMIAQLQIGYLALSKLFNKEGKYQDAYLYHVKQARIKDSLLNSTISEQALRIDALTDFERVQREQQLNLLSAQNEIQQLRLRRSREILVFAILSILILSTLLVWIYRSRSSIKKLYDELETQKSLIAKSLEEKEFLLKEIHHRVKNNLQVISSLLNLQSRSMSDKMAQQALNEGRNRVRSMALIHQNLYQDENNLTSIKVLNYLDQLTSSLMASYRINQEKVHLKLAVDDIALDVDSLIPIGLIINELVSNSLKYAFPDGREGEISISLHERADKTLHLKVADNGVGYNEAPNSSPSFGYRLIRAFSERLQAEYEIRGEDGTQVEFIIKNYQSAA